VIHNSTLPSSKYLGCGNNLSLFVVCFQAKIFAASEMKIDDMIQLGKTKILLALGMGCFVWRVI